MVICYSFFSVLNMIYETQLLFYTLYSHLTVYDRCKFSLAPTRNVSGGQGTVVQKTE